MTIPAFDLTRQYARIQPAMDAAVLGVLSRGNYILGENVAAFEQEFASYCGVEFGVGVASGTEALHLALLALDIGAGDEVITVAHTAVATVAAIELAGARPVLVDVEPATMTMDPTRVEERISSRCKAILPVHLYGHPADLDALGEIAKRRGLHLIEDCAQAHGAVWQGRRVGGFGRLGCFSFYPTKNLGAYGDGGMIVTNDIAMQRRLRRLRQYGWQERYISAVRGGVNSRLDELQAAILRVKLRHLQEWTTARRALAARYTALLAYSGVTAPCETEQAQHVYHLYVIRCQQRDALRAHLAAHGVGAAVHYPTPVHVQPGYADLARGPGSLPVSERLAGEILSLPMFPELTVQEVEQAARSVRSFCRAQGLAP